MVHNTYRNNSSSIQRTTDTGLRGGGKQLKTILLRFLLVTAIVFLSVSVSAVSLNSNGEVHTITQGNLQFQTDGSGLVKLYKNGSANENYLGAMGFTLKGTVNAQEKFLNSWSTSWTWEVLSNTDSNITVLGSTTWQGLDWKQRWFFSDTEQKFTNYLTNNTGFDITNTSFYYVFRIDETNVSCLHYVDNQGKGNEYCFEEDITKTQNLNQFLKRINFKETMFNFQDLIDSGFEFNYLFAGELANVKPTLAGKGFIIGVTKNGGLFPNGASIELDPSVIDTSDLSLTNYGNTIVRDSSGNIFTVQEVVVNSFTDIFVSKSTDDGVSFTSFNLTNSPDVNEMLPHIDINSTDGLMIEFDWVDGNRNIYVTTCSLGGCDSNTQFLDKFNVSACGDSSCANGNIYHDQNGTSHVSYAKAEDTLHYRSNTGFVGSTWSAEEDVGSVGAGAVTGRDGTGVLVANNGSDIKIVYTNANGAQANIGFFNGTLWSPTVLELVSTGVQEPLEGFAGYDGNFYLTYSKDVSGTDASNQIHFRQCSDDCNILGNWSTDLNVTSGGLNLSRVSLFQSADLNVNIIASSLVSANDANLFHFVRTPDNIFVTSSLADGNLLFSDANRTYNPLVRNRGYDGSVLGFPLLPIFGNIEMDYVFLTSSNSQGDPSTLVFDTNSYVLGNGITTSFTTKPVSPIALDPELGITNIQTDGNSTTSFFGPIVDINYLWQVDGEEITTDQNMVIDLNGTERDINFSLITQGNDGIETFTSQQDQNILLRTNAQDIDINFVFNAEPTLLDVNYGVTADGTTTSINYAVWGFPNDNNLSGLVVNQQYRVGDNRAVCVVVNTTGDVNKLHCEDFFSTHITVKVPKDITDLSLITPFDASIDSVPAQSFSGLTVDGNFWFFYQTVPDSNTHNLIVDANVSFFLSTYFIGLNAFDLNQTIQPYMVPATEGINVILTAKDSLTNSTVQGVVIAFNRIVSTDGSVLTISGVTDDLGRISLPFIAGIDHNFTLQFPFGTILRTGSYIPQTIDATDGVGISIASTSLFDVNAIGVTDINFLQSQARPNSPIDINVIVESSTRAIAAITVRIDHNGVFLDSNSVGIVPLPYDFNFSIEVGGLSVLIPVIVTVDINYVDGGTFQTTKAVTIVTAAFNLFDSFTSAQARDLGELGGTMFLSAILIAILLGIVHFSFPAVDNTFTFVFAATILLFLSFVGWVDGVTWVIATIGAGTIYFMRRVDK